MGKSLTLIMATQLKFRSVVSLVIGSQIGSGVFLLPASLAGLGAKSLFGWLISSFGAILLALVFGQLSMLISKGGGPHTYIEKAFGRQIGFFVAWTYWLISWVSSLAVIVAAASYLSPLLGFSSPLAFLFTELAILTLITLVNIRGTSLAGSLEFVLTVLKCTPLIIIPLVALFFLKTEYFQTPTTAPLFDTLNTATLMTFWGFVGLESATTSTNIIENPTKVIPRAVIIGTSAVAALYFLNSFGIMGVVPPALLAHSQAPYVDAAEILFGGGWNLVIALVGFLACLGTLNAWVLTSSQIAKEASKENLFPPLFSKTNKRGAPYMSLLIAFICTALILIFSLTPNLLAQLNAVIDLSVTAFLLIYLLSALALLKILRTAPIKHRALYRMITLLAIAFCLWVLAFTSPANLLISFLFTLTGVPIYFLQKKSWRLNKTII